MAPAFFRIVLYVLIALGPLLLLALTSSTHYAFLSELGRSAALVGFMLLALQAVLAGRFKWVLRPFGFDIVIRFHRNMAIVALALIILHPILLAAGNRSLHLISSLDLPWYIHVGRGALAAVILIALLSMSGIPDRMGFERWRVFHDILAPAVVLLALIHSYNAGDDLRLAWMRWVWIAAAIVSLAAYFYHRFLRPFMLSRRPYSVTSVREESPGVWDITLRPPEKEAVFDYLPGQFQFITFHRAEGLPEEEHHWTISSSPTEGGSVKSTIKELGDFTATIGKTRPGDTATVHAPFGRFSYLLHPDENDLVFIAGGVGITPLISMLRHMRDSGSEMPVLLVYANRDAESIAFRDELEDIARGERPRLRIVHILSEPSEDWAGETGRLDAEKLSRFCDGRFDGRGFYVCGPPGLLRSVIGALESRSVSYRHIHMEIFSFLD